MDDEQILNKGGDEEDIRKYAEENGANLTKEDVDTHTNKQLQNLIGKAIGKDYLKLEFGCKWKKYEDWVYIEGFSITTNQKGGWTSVPPEESEILGTEPTLADVLLAVARKKGGHIYTDYLIRVIMGQLLLEYNGKIIAINLEKSLFNQIDEVKEALINLITPTI